MYAKHLLSCAILLAIGHTINAEYNVNAFCPLVADNTKLGSVESCQKYYVCKNGVATAQLCPEGQSWNKKTGLCGRASSVDCYFGISNPCANKQDAHIPLVGTCNGWIYCQKGVEAGRGSCGSGQIFADGQCKFGNCNDHINAGQDSSFTSVCNIMPNDVYFGSTLACNTWQVCINDELFSGDCSTTYNYDVQMGKCNHDDKVNCDRVTGINIQPDGEKMGPCLASQTGDLEPSASRCSLYKECDGTNWVRKSCPTAQFYDVISNGCKSRQKATPVDTCDRCEGTKKQFVNKVDKHCQKYLVCENGVKKGDGSCPNPKAFFNEASGSCVNVSGENKTKYVRDNGACHNNCDCDEDPNNVIDCDQRGAAGCNCNYNDSECVSCGVNACNLCSGEDQPTCIANDKCQFDTANSKCIGK